jgi:hypothetical protein
MPVRSAPGPTGSPENCRAAADAILLAAAKTGMGLRDLAGLAPVILSFRVSQAGTTARHTHQCGRVPCSHQAAAIRSKRPHFDDRAASTFTVSPLIPGSGKFDEA